MKKLSSLLVLIVLGLFTYAQQFPADTVKNKTYYFKKSKSKETIAWILLGAGAAATTVAIIKANQDPFNNSDAPGILFVGGLACMLGSIPLFISSSHNMKKAFQLTAELKIQENSKLIQMYVGNYHPAVSFKLNLK